MDPDGLLFYTDDGGQYDFFELRMKAGKLLLRYKTDSSMGKIQVDDFPVRRRNRRVEMVDHEDAVDYEVHIDDQDDARMLN